MVDGGVCVFSPVYPGGIEDAAANECTELTSSIIIEFVPVEQTATPTT